MRQSLPTGVPTFSTPSFYITGRQPLRPAAILLAIAVAAIALSAVLFALEHTRHTPFTSENSDSANSANSGSGATADDDKDDPNQIDTIVLGDPADAPVPARRNNHISPVHPTILVHLPRFGDQVGLIPNTPAGHLLYDWLAAFNQANSSALSNVLPGIETAGQMELRQLSGGFTLLSAKEVQPGILVFRLHDQTPAATEVLGTLQMRPNANPAAIATFSLRAVSPPHQDAITDTDSLSPTAPH